MSHTFFALRLVWFQGSSCFDFLIFLFGFWLLNALRFFLLIVEMVITTSVTIMLVLKLRTLIICNIIDDKHRLQLRDISLCWLLFLSGCSVATVCNYALHRRWYIRLNVYRRRLQKLSICWKPIFLWVYLFQLFFLKSLRLLLIVVEWSAKLVIQAIRGAAARLIWRLNIIVALFLSFFRNTQLPYGIYWEAGLRIDTRTTLLSIRLFLLILDICWVGRRLLCHDLIMWSCIFMF